MCTVTFISRPPHIFITSNRDESPGRRANGLTTIGDNSSGKIHFPIDETSGGSWITLNDTGRAVCLLNGAFTSFVPKPSYRMSRGQVVLAASRATHAEAFIHDADLEGIAPFTLLIYEHPELHELVWDGQQKHIQVKPTDQPWIWSSATLYPPEVRAWRQDLFDRWYRDTQDIDRDAIIAFHRQANGDSDNGFIMNRNEIVKTLSVTSIHLQPDAGSILHVELDQDIKDEIVIRHDE